MTVGRYIAMVGFLVWRHGDGRYLLLKRSLEKDFSPGEWKIGSGRLEQGEGFAEALKRESREKLGIELRAECIVGSTHFHRGEQRPENKLVGVIFGCSVPDDTEFILSEEHTDYRWMTADEARNFPQQAYWLASLMDQVDNCRQSIPCLANRGDGGEFDALTGRCPTAAL